MSLLSTFIQTHLLHAIEEQFLSHAPDIQEIIINEMQYFGTQCIEWVNAKIEQKSLPKEE